MEQVKARVRNATPEQRAAFEARRKAHEQGGWH